MRQLYALGATRSSDAASTETRAPQGHPTHAGSSHRRFREGDRRWAHPHGSFLGTAFVDDFRRKLVIDWIVNVEESTPLCCSEREVTSSPLDTWSVALLSVA